MKNRRTCYNADLELQTGWPVIVLACRRTLAELLREKQGGKATCIKEKKTPLLKRIKRVAKKGYVKVGRKWGGANTADRLAREIEGG